MNDISTRKASADPDAGRKLVKELHQVKSDRRKEAFGNSAPVLIVKGLWLFAEGTALLVTSIYAIYQGHYGSLPVWGRTGLTIAGVLVLIPAAILLSKFFRKAAQA